MIVACKCDQPQQPVNPRQQGSCTRCGRIIPPEWNSSEIKGLLKGFEESIHTFGPVYEDPAGSWTAFRDYCLAREAAGRDAFGYRFMDRDNCIDGIEEAVDGANYAMFDIIKARKTGEHIDESAALTAVYHAWKLYEALILMKNKRTGSP